MRASYQWIRELSGVDAPPGDLAERLTRAGLEVESLTPVGRGLDRVVVAEVRGRRPHPAREKLSLVTVFDGVEELEVVCGAPNVPAPGGRVLFARLGAQLPGGLEIQARALGGIESRGMICSEAELGLGDGGEGIFVLAAGEGLAPGTPIAEALGLVDTVLELNVTPNRPDALGHVGIAREVALLYGVPFAAPRAATPPRIGEDAPGVLLEGERFSLPDHLVPGPTERRAGVGAAAHAALGRRISVTLDDAERCPRYGAAVVLGLRAAPSPFWLRYRLHTLGLRALVNLVDVTNYVLLEWGHPIHAFDLGALAESRIVVRRAAAGESMRTLDGVARTFTPDDLLICDGRSPVAVAGVMGGEGSAVHDGTRDVLIECAYFEPRGITRTARRLGLHTDSSHRFERGVDRGAVRHVLARAAALLGELGGGVVLGEALDVHPEPREPRPIRFRPSRVALLLGEAAPRGEPERILTALGCAVASVGEHLAVEPPTWRPDLGREADLIEEVARVRGYDHIPTEIPYVRPSAAGTSPELASLRRLREAAAAAGLDEAVGYAFLAPRDLVAARVSTEAVALLNPLSEERSVMRTSLLPGLAAAARRSQHHQVERIRLFELGRVYLAEPADAHPSVEGELPTERRRLGILLAGPRPAWIGDEGPADFYDGKGVVAGLLANLLPEPPVTVLAADLATRAPWLHPRRSAEVRVAGQPIGHLGELHPAVAEDLGLSGAVVWAELDADALVALAGALGVRRARPLARFPAVSRDIAMLVDEVHPAGAIAEVLAQAAGGLAEDVRLFDLYRGPSIPEGARSLAFRITYRDPNETLTDKRVDTAHARVGKAAVERFGATLR